MNNWDKYKRMQINIDKALLNAAVTNLTMKHYDKLHKELVVKDCDQDIFHDTYLKLTYKYNPDKDFREQFRWLFYQLKGAYFRDDKGAIIYRLDDSRLVIPDFLSDEETIPSKDASIVDKLKAILKI